MSPIFVGLEPKTAKGGISTAAPPRLASGLHSLPPILHMTAPSPMPGYSKAPQGLFVLPQVARVFTGTVISPSPPSRQWPSRSTIHAGRNLPDKGLRYLRHFVTPRFRPCDFHRSVFTGWAGHFCRPLHVAMQIGPYLPSRSARGSGVWSLRIPEACLPSPPRRGGETLEGVYPSHGYEEDLFRVFPAGGPHRTHCHQPLMMSRQVAPDTRAFQHIARFYNGLKSPFVPVDPNRMTLG